MSDQDIARPPGVSIVALVCKAMSNLAYMLISLIDFQHLWKSLFLSLLLFRREVLVEQVIVVMVGMVLLPLSSLGIFPRIRKLSQ